MHLFFHLAVRIFLSKLCCLFIEFHIGIERTSKQGKTSRMAISMSLFLQSSFIVVATQSSLFLLLFLRSIYHMNNSSRNGQKRFFVFFNSIKAKSWWKNKLNVDLPKLVIGSGGIPSTWQRLVFLFGLFISSSKSKAHSIYCWSGVITKSSRAVFKLCNNKKKTNIEKQRALVEKVEKKHKFDIK